MQQPALISFIVLLPMLLMGVVFWFCVRTRRGVLFGVTVPLDFAETAEARRIIATYRTRTTLLTLLASAACIAPILRAVPWLYSVATPALVAGGIVFWQLARRLVRPHQIMTPLERTASLSTSSERTAGWLSLNVLALSPLALAWFYLQRHWTEIPDRFPTHWNVSGMADHFVARSTQTVAVPLLMGAGIIVFLGFLAGFLRFVPMPDRSRATRLMLPTLTVLAWSLSALFSFIALQPIRNTLTSSGVSFAVLGHLLVVSAIIFWITRQLVSTQGKEAYDGTPDSGWRAGGLVYYNPADAAVMVPKRFGWGWTLNFARPVTWGYCAGLALLIALFGLFSFLLR